MDKYLSAVIIAIIQLGKYLPAPSIATMLNDTVRSISVSC